MVPIVEIGIFISVGEQIGLWPTLLGILITTVAGVALVRFQGLQTLRRMQETLARHEPPVRELFDGTCILLGGALLLIPGFLTDVIGLLLLLPPLRTALHRVLLRRGFAGAEWQRTERQHAAWRRTETYRAGAAAADRGSPRPGGNPWAGPVIDVEYEDVGRPDRREDDGGSSGEGEHR